MKRCASAASSLHITHSNTCGAAAAGAWGWRLMSSVLWQGWAARCWGVHQAHPAPPTPTFPLPSCFHTLAMSPLNWR